LHNFRAVLWLEEGDQFIENSGLPDLLETRKDSVMVVEGLYFEEAKPETQKQRFTHTLQSP
jgi:hypothetical protein